MFYFEEHKIFRRKNNYVFNILFFYYTGYIELISGVYFFMILPMTAFGIIYCFILRDLFSLLFLITTLYFFILFYIGIPYEIGDPVPNFSELFIIYTLVIILYNLLLNKNKYTK